VSSKQLSKQSFKGVTAQFFSFIFFPFETMKTTLQHIHQYLRSELTLRASLIAFALGVLFTLVVALTPNYQILLYALSRPEAFFKIFFGLIRGIFTSMPLYGAVMLVIIGFLTGLNVVLIAKRSLRLRQAGAVGVGSMFGALLGGCSACATGILPLLGMSGALAVLPFHGSEFAVLAIVILVATVYWNAYAEVCAIQKK
jgi:hypothetical protein